MNNPKLYIYIYIYIKFYYNFCTVAAFAFDLPVELLDELPGKYLGCAGESHDLIFLLGLSSDGLDRLGSNSLCRQLFHYQKHIPFRKHNNTVFIFDLKKNINIY